MKPHQFKRAAGVAAFLAVMLGAGAVAAQTAAAQALRPLDLPIEGVITPEWTQIPTSDQMAQFYPKLPEFLNLAGRVRLDCLTTAAGGLEQCVVASERPGGLGFGAAAVALSAYFHLKPRTVGGSAVGGDETSVSLAFQMPAEAPPAYPRSTLAPTAARMRAIKLARQLIIASGLEANVDGQLNMFSQQIKGRLAGPLSTSGDGAALDQAAQALDEAARSAVPAYLDRLSQVYAQTYSEAELNAILTFMRSPAGKAWTAHQADLPRQVSQIWTQLWLSVSDDARRRLCQRIDCGAQPAAATR
jgi:hypothetical protein